MTLLLFKLLADALINRSHSGGWMTDLPVAGAYYRANRKDTQKQAGTL
ncbi:hypothetical protein N9444_09075 [Gammaproteobacteria bacterium]|nr:hypothetical protein [Gammaproteobacteria bacterium]